MQPSEQDEIRHLMQETLQEDYLRLTVLDYQLRDDLLSGWCSINLTVEDSRDGNRTIIEGMGVGLVDAAWNGFQDKFSSDHPSLRSLRFSRFQARGLVSSGHGQRFDAETRVEIGICNSYDTEFYFGLKSRSLGRACVQVVADAVQYFANSERTFIAMYKARRHYQDIERDDLVTKYTNLMTSVVKNTSYSVVIDRVRSELDD